MMLHSCMFKVGHSLTVEYQLVCSSLEKSMSTSPKFVGNKQIDQATEENESTRKND